MRASDRAEEVLWENEGINPKEFDLSDDGSNQSNHGISSVAGATLGSEKISKESTDEINLNPRSSEKRNWFWQSKEDIISPKSPPNKSVSSPEQQQQEFCLSPSASSEQNSYVGSNISIQSIRTSRDNIDGTPLLRKQFAKARLSVCSQDDLSVDYSVIEANNRMKKAQLFRKVSELTEMSSDALVRVKGWGDPLMDPIQDILRHQEEEDIRDEDDDESVQSNSELFAASATSDIIFQPSGNHGHSTASRPSDNRGSFPPVGWYPYNAKPLKQLKDPLASNLEKAEPTHVKKVAPGTSTNTKTSHLTAASTTRNCNSILELHNIDEDLQPTVYTNAQNVAVDSKRKFGPNIEQQRLFVATKLSHSGEEMRGEVSPLTPASMMVKNRFPSSRSSPDTGISSLPSLARTNLTTDESDLALSSNLPFNNISNDTEDAVSSPGDFFARGYNDNTSKPHKVTGRGITYDNIPSLLDPKPKKGAYDNIPSLLDPKPEKGVCMTFEPSIAVNVKRFHQNYKFGRPLSIETNRSISEVPESVKRYNSTPVPAPSNNYISNNVTLRAKKDEKESLSPLMLYQCAVIGDASLSCIPSASKQFRKTNSEDAST